MAEIKVTLMVRADDIARIVIITSITNTILTTHYNSTILTPSFPT